MYYYYVRFNVYLPHHAPSQKEEWLKFTGHYDDQKIKRYLSEVFNAEVTIISCVPIEEEQYRNHESERY